MAGRPPLRIAGVIERVRSIRDKLLRALDLDEAEAVRGGTAERAGDDAASDPCAIPSPGPDPKRRPSVSRFGDAFRNFPNFPNFSNWRNR